MTRVMSCPIAAETAVEILGPVLGVFKDSQNQIVVTYLQEQDQGRRCMVIAVGTGQQVQSHWRYIGSVEIFDLYHYHLFVTVE